MNLTAIASARINIVKRQSREPRSKGVKYISEDSNCTKNAFIVDLVEITELVREIEKVGCCRN